MYILMMKKKEKKTTFCAQSLIISLWTKAHTHTHAHAHSHTHQHRHQYRLMNNVIYLFIFIFCTFHIPYPDAPTSLTLKTYRYNIILFYPVMPRNDMYAHNKQLTLQPALKNSKSAALPVFTRCAFFTVDTHISASYDQYHGLGVRGVKPTSLTSKQCLCKLVGSTYES